MKVVAINSSWLSISGSRLDASYHLSDGINTKRIIKEFCPYDSRELKDLCSDLYKGDIHKRIYVPSADYGYIFYTASDLFKSDLNSGKFISKKLSPHLDKLELKKGWILISRSGTLGRVIFTNEEHEGTIGTDDMVRINPTSELVHPGYLYAFLASKFGFSLLTQSSYGGVVKHIEPHHIENIKIPMFPNQLQVKIHNLITKSAELRVEAQRKKKEFHEIFDLSTDFQPRRKNFGTFSFKKVQMNFHQRLDSSHYINIEEPETELSKSHYGSVRLGDIVEKKMFTAQRGKRNYIGSNGIKFLSTTDISEINPLMVEKYLSWNTQGLETLIVKENWILISSSGQDILGSSFIVDKTYAECAVNQHSLRVIIDKSKISPFYVFGYLSTPKIKEYIRSGIYGSAVLTIDENFLKNLLVPILDNEKMDKIVELVKSMVQNFEQACFMEKEAIGLVEKEIGSWEK